LGQETATFCEAPATGVTEAGTFECDLNVFASPRILQSEIELIDSNMLTGLIMSIRNDWLDLGSWKRVA
jgi:hypothetical protein